MEPEIQDLGELIEDHRRLCVEHQLEWDLSRSFRLIGDLLTHARQSEQRDEPVRSDLHVLKAGLMSAQLCYAIWAFLGIAGTVLLAIYVSGIFVEHGPRKLTTTIGFVVLCLPALYYASRKRRFQKAVKLFESYSENRDFIRETRAGRGRVRIDIARLWPVAWQRRLRLAGIRWLCHWRSNPESDLVHVHALNMNLSKLLMVGGPAFLVGDQMIIMCLLVFAIGAWLIWSGNSIRILLAQSGPSTVSELIAWHQKFPDRKTVYSDNPMFARNPHVKSPNKLIEWIARRASKIRRICEPDYQMCVQLEKPCFKWMFVGLGITRLGFQQELSRSEFSPSMFAVILLGLATAGWAAHRQNKADWLRMHFEKFAQENVSEIELVNGGETIHIKPPATRQPSHEPALARYHS